MSVFGIVFVGLGVVRSRRIVSTTASSFESDDVGFWVCSVFNLFCIFVIVFFVCCVLIFVFVSL